MRSRTANVIRAYSLPGPAVFPESVGMDPLTGDAYVGGLADGTLYRLAAGSGAVEVWSAAGADGRSSVAGVKVDARGRLWAAGGYTGALAVYDTRSGDLLAQMDVGAHPSCVNDVAFDQRGHAYVTDSFVPVLFRVDSGSLELERWVDLTEHGMPWPEGLNLNGVVLAQDGRHLVSCQTNLGRFWRVALADGAVDEVALDGGPLEHCDGLALDGSTLYAAINARDLIAVIDLAEDAAAGSLRAMVASQAFAFPTAVAADAGRLLVVNGQLDKLEAGPRLPFTVVSIAKPELSAPGCTGSSPPTD